MPKTSVPIDEGQVLFDVRRVFTLKAFINISKAYIQIDLQEVL